jgi:hypothetical protein
MMLRKLLVLTARVVALSCALGAARAHASPLTDLTGDTTSAGGLQASTVAGGAAAAYFNPALLIDAPAALCIGFMILNERIGVELDGRPGTQYAIPEGLANAAHADGTRFDNYAISTNELQYGRAKDARHEAFLARPRQGAGSGHDTLTYEVVGLVVKLFEQHLALGMHALVPNGGFTHMRAFFNDEREQYFSNSLHPELYSDRMTAVTLAMGAGVAITRNLSLGVGATLGLKANVVAPTYVVDAGRLSDILIDINASVNIGIAPHFGVSYKPIERLHLSATVHTPQRVELGTSFTFLLTNGVEQSSGVTLVLDYTPWQVALGGSFDLIQETEQTLSIATTLLYAAWSGYTDRHGAAPVDAYAWADTLSPTLGLRYRWQDLSALLDVSYTPTPVPPQTGRSNYVDNDRISSSLGAQYRFTVLHTDFWIGVQAQVHKLLERHQTKLPTPTSPDGTNLAPNRVKDELPDDAQISGEPVASAAGLQTNNPGWPGFTSGGWILGGTLTLSVAL